jgi:hypothetical protein
MVVAGVPFPVRLTRIGQQMADTDFLTWVNALSRLWWPFCPQRLDQQVAGDAPTPKCPAPVPRWFDLSITQRERWRCAAWIGRPVIEATSTRGMLDIYNQPWLRAPQDLINTRQAAIL